VSALLEVFGARPAVETYAFEGKLDPVIVAELMREAGVPDDDIRKGLTRALSLYLDRLEAALAAEKPRLKPGVERLLDAVCQAPEAVPALLTGNVERGARIKLSAAGLWHRFRFGVFGDEAERREELGALALARVRAATGRSFVGASASWSATRARTSPAESHRRAHRGGGHRKDLQGGPSRRGSRRRALRLFRPRRCVRGDPWLTRGKPHGGP